MKPIGNDIPNAVDDSSDSEETIGWDTLQIIFAPWMIPHIALRCSRFYALLVSSSILTWEIGFIFFGYIQGIGEPFPDWRSYLFVYKPGVLFIFFIIHTTILFFIIRFFSSLFSYVFKINPASMRAVLLTPTILIFPSHIWSFANVVIQVRCPTFQLGTGKPEWINWAIFTLLSEPYWLAIGVIALIGAGFVNAFRVRKLYSQKNSLEANSSVPK